MDSSVLEPFWGSLVFTGSFAVIQIDQDIEKMGLEKLADSLIYACEDLAASPLPKTPQQNEKSKV